MHVESSEKFGGDMINVSNSNNHNLKIENIKFTKYKFIFEKNLRFFLEGKLEINYK